MRKTSVRPHFCKYLILLVFLGGCGDSGTPQSSIPIPPAAPVTSIPLVQGSGDASPFEGQVLSVVGIVSGDFQNDDADDTRNLGGFFLQAEKPDGDPDTSDGIFVFDGNAPATDVVAGQIVQVYGTVTEHFGETQITASSVTVTGSGTVQPTSLEFPLIPRRNSDGQYIADLERFEGMLVELVAPMYVTEAYNLERYGEVSLSHGGRLRQFTNEFEPDVAGFAAHRQTNASRSLILDDGLVSNNPEAIRFLRPAANNAPDYTLRIGDTVATAIGNIRFSRGSGASGFEAYRLEPTVQPVFEATNIRPDTPPDTGGAITVASFNVLNYFTTIDSGRGICGPSADMGCRGADSDDEFDRQRAKTIRALLALDADIVGLMELENNGGVALTDIVTGLNAELGAVDWDFVDSGVIGADAISVGLIYRMTTVEPVGDFAILDSLIDSRFDDSKNRPTLAQTFDVIAGGRLTVAVNHLKSKGSDCDDVADPNLDDGQGECNRTRTRAAAALGDWLYADPTGSGDPDILIIGDMNSYLLEDPVVALEGAGFVNLLKKTSAAQAYSFVFDGQSGALDHAFASRTLESKITGAAEWHINADEPPLIDYNLDFGRDAGLFDETTPYRTSDHDPVIIGINP